MAERIKTTPSRTVHNIFGALCHLHRSEAFRIADSRGSAVTETVFSDLLALPRFARERLTHIRSWYSWCSLQELEQFPDVIADQLREIRIGSNEVGHAVRTQDPIEGAFDEIELIAIVSKLRALGPRLLSTAEIAICWLAIATGCNPHAFALLREEDLKHLVEEETGRIHGRLEVPRIKKGATQTRRGYHPKMLNEEIDQCVTQLIIENQKSRESGSWPEGCAYPLFPRSEPNLRRLNGQLREYAMHGNSGFITRLLVRAVEKLQIYSHRTEGPLHVTARRFRRTYGTRAVEEGATPSELAVMLDHSTLDTVFAYFETRANQVLRLDAAAALTLAPIADAFMGRLVNEERDAINGDNIAKRIPWYRRHPNKSPEKNGHLGTCGAGACGLFAPISCYTCQQFQAWKSGPHEEVLNWLCAERDRREQDGLDPQIVNFHNATILAVAEVVVACRGDIT